MGVLEKPMLSQIVPLATDTDIIDDAAVIQKASDILRLNDVFQIPVQIDAICNNHGYKVGEAEFPPNYQYVRGFLDLEDTAIIVSKEDPIDRKVYAIAHLFGHIVLHSRKLREDPGGLLILTNETFGRLDQDPYERAANLFAAHVLMPEQFLKKYTDLPENGLASVFGVPVDLVLYRLKDQPIYHQVA